ncbi:MAG: hypothetical protein ABIL68_14770 [bacterium]
MCGEKQALPIGGRACLFIPTYRDGERNRQALLVASADDVSADLFERLGNRLYFLF